eukprot:TRINITY_DN3116_c1_g1_i1.p1 TRINITY_DN3116_c1_g1~~TRINITY_DN3116_c1_g1_i1.p1  ORF type:complete len:663 (+),score=200.33 TRINITY_DN3116_c1_g1_i1:56-2044(+)
MADESPFGARKKPRKPPQQPPADEPAALAGSVRKEKRLSSKGSVKDQEGSEASVRQRLGDGLATAARQASALSTAQAQPAAAAAPSEAPRSPVDQSLNASVIRRGSTGSAGKTSAVAATAPAGGGELDALAATVRSIGSPLKPPEAQGDEEAGGAAAAATGSAQDIPAIAVDASADAAQAEQADEAADDGADAAAAAGAATPSAQDLDAAAEEQQQAEPAAASAADARELEHENEKLKAQIASLQRLLAGGSQDAKLKRLTEDLAAKAKRVKELEADLGKQKREVESARSEAEKAKKELAAAKSKKGGHSEHHHHHTASDKDRDREIEQREARIRDLEAKLNKAESAARNRDSAAKAGRTRSGAEPERLGSGSAWSDVGPQATPKAQTVQKDTAALAQVSTLKRQVEQLQSGLTERDAAMQQLKLKLERAQEAIIGSAGSGWESDVKLHQTRAMLQRLLRSVSPHPASPQRQHPTSPSPPRVDQVLSTHGSGGAPAGSMFKDADGRVVYVCASREAGPRPALVQFVNGVRTAVLQSPVVCRQLPKGVELRDGGGTVTRLSSTAVSDGTLSRIAQLCNSCGVAHDIPGGGGADAQMSAATLVSPNRSPGGRVSTPAAASPGHRGPLSPPSPFGSGAAHLFGAARHADASGVWGGPRAAGPVWQ